MTALLSDSPYALRASGESFLAGKPAGGLRARKVWKQLPPSPSFKDGCQYFEDG